MKGRDNRIDMNGVFRAEHESNQRNEPMSTALKQVLKGALSLSEPEKLELVDEILSTLAVEEAALLEDAWLAEIERRSAAYDKGRMKTVAWEKVIARARRRRRANGCIEGL